jgi:hypothetical protein
MEDWEFMELQDLVNPVIHNHMPLEEEIQQHIALGQDHANDVGMDVDHAQPGDSSLTLTISSVPTSSDGSGAFVNEAPYLMVQLPMAWSPIIFSLAWLLFLI